MTIAIAHEEDTYSWMQAALEKVVLDPKYHDILTLVKGVRNGMVYGAKVRFPHALVYATPATLLWEKEIC